MKISDAAYIAGLFDGEGSVEYKKRKQQKTKRNTKNQKKTKEDKKQKIHGTN